MRRFRFLLAAVVVGLLATGCIRSDLTVAINDDGSGTYSAIVAFNPKAIGQLAQLGGQDTGGLGKDPCKQIRDSANGNQDKLPSGAKVENYSDGDFCGVKITAPFAAGQNPSDAISKALGEGQIWTDKELFVFGPCVDAVAGARVPSIAAPPEREAGCRLRHFVAEATDEARVLSVLLDHVVIAAWALDVALGASTLQHAEGEHHLFIAALAPVRSRYERIAVTRPVAAILAGMTARLLAADPAARAKAWGRFGEVPLDVAARGLH